MEAVNSCLHTDVRQTGLLFDKCIALLTLKKSILRPHEFGQLTLLYTGIKFQHAAPKQANKGTLLLSQLHYL
jgi:hypothetical protein